jgi:SAM-dependent methyltransferase
MLVLATFCIISVLMTYTLCTIPDTRAALSQMIRVLKPRGQLIFCEHGAAPDQNVQIWQDRLSPIWSRLGGGCRLNRRIPDLIEQGGFRIANINADYIPGGGQRHTITGAQHPSHDAACPS